MTPKEMLAACNEAIAGGEQVVLTVQKGKLPFGFPFGEMICELGNRQQMSFNPHKVKEFVLSRTGGRR